MLVVNKSKLQSNNIDIITKLRGVAALIVFLFHLVCLSNNYISSKILNSIFTYGKYGVQMFFVISGFVISYSMISSEYKLNNFFTFLKKRLIRIEPPYIFMVFITICFLFLRKYFFASSSEVNLPTFNQFLFHLSYLIPFSKYSWLSIVAIEFQFYIICSLIFSYLKEFIVFCIIFNSIFVLLFFLSSSEAHFFYWCPIFLLGIYLALLKKNLIGFYEFIIFSSFFLLSILIKLKFNIFIFSFLPLLIIYFEPKVKSNLLDFFGKISYSLYLSHTLIAFTIINLGIRYTTSMYQKVFFISAAILITIIFSYLLYFYIEKPSKKTASLINYKRDESNNNN